jgi:hypothetical protein
MTDKDFQKWRETVEKLEKGGITKNPYIFKACKQCWEGNCRPLEKLLLKKPSLIRIAERNIAEIETAEEECPLRPPPDEHELESFDGDIPLGRIKFSEGKILAKYSWLNHHLGLYGSTGTGKTLLLMKMLHHILSDKDRKFNVIVFDPKNDFSHMVKLHPTLKIIRKKDLLYNHFEVYGAKTKEDVEIGMKTDVSVLADVCYFGATGQPIIESGFWDCFIEKGLGRWPTFKDLLIKTVMSAQQKKLQGARTSDVLTTIKVRFDQFIRTGEVFNCEQGYPLSFYLYNDIIINMGGMNEFERGLFGIGLTMKIFMHLMKHNIRRDKLRVLFVFDEGYLFFDSEKDGDPYVMNAELKKLFRMGREFGMGFIVSGSSISSISKYVRENTSTIIAFRTQDKNLEDVKINIGLTEDQTRYIYKLAQKFEGIVRIPEFERPILFELEPNFYLAKDVTSEQIDAHMKPIISDLLAQLKPSGKNEPEPIDLYEIELQATNQKLGILILRKLKENPFFHHTQLVDFFKDELGFSKKNFEYAAAWLEQQQLVAPTKCRSSKTKDALFYPMTPKAQISLKILESDRIAPTHFKHTLYCEFVKGQLESQGYEAIREFGFPYQQMQSSQRIDVFAVQNGQNVAYEITLTLNTKDIVANITKCLFQFRVDRLFIVCERKEPDIDIAQEIIAENVSHEFHDKIQLVSMTDYL